MATAGFGGVSRPNMFAPRYGGEHANPAPNAGAAAFQGGRTNRSATEGAKHFKDTLGLPSFEDLLGKLGSGGSTREYGNAGRAGEGADFLRSEYEKAQQDLRRQQGNVGAARKGVRNPTGTEGFKGVMRLTNERLGNAAENDRRLAAEAASRRGYVGGYSGERGDQERREALASAGYEAAEKEREAQLDLFSGEADLYGSMLGGRGQLVSGYSDLTRTAAELPTKWLDSYSSLLGGLTGGFGDIFGTASKNVMFDTSNEREDLGAARQSRSNLRRGIQGSPGVRGFA